MKVEIELTSDQVKEVNALRDKKAIGEYMLVIVKAGISQKQREVKHAADAKAQREQNKAILKASQTNPELKKLIDAALAKK